MALWDLFTGDPLKQAAADNRNLLTNTQQGVLSRTNNAKNEAQGYINTGYDGARNVLSNGYAAGTNAINTGAGSALDYLGQGADSAVGTLTAGGGAYAGLGDLASRYRVGADRYADALGLNGADGATRAREGFVAGPGYQSGIDAGIDSIARLANASGQYVGGNTIRDAQTFGQDYQNKEWGGYLDRLAGYNPLELSATQGAAAGNAGINTNVANIQNTAGQNRAQIATGQGQNIADLARGYYGATAANDVGQYNALAGNVMNATGMQNAADANLAPQVGKTYTDEANAEMTAGKNVLGLGMSLASLAAGAAGGGFGGGFGGGSFGGMGGNLGATGAFDPSMWNKSLPANGFNW